MFTSTAAAAIVILAGLAQPIGSPRQAVDNGKPAPKEAQPVAAAAARDDSAAEKIGFKLGTQAWTFRDRSAFEAVDTAKMLGLKYIEFFSGQQLMKDNTDIKMGPELSKEHREALKKHLKDSGVTAVSFGVVGFSTGKPDDEAKARAIFDFAQDMGMKTITCEPEENAWDMVEKLAGEYKITAAVHNHPKPSHYWHPEVVLKAIKGRKNCGACADLGHWPRSGLTPLQCVKELDGKIITVHFKDIKDGQDQPWGTGNSDVRAIMKELRRQKFAGVLSLEYETGAGKELEENARKCIAFFDRVCAEIVAEEAKAKNEKPAVPGEKK